MKSHREQRQSSLQPDSKPKQPRIRTFHDIPSAPELREMEQAKQTRAAERQGEDAALEQALARIDVAESFGIDVEPHVGHVEKDPLRQRGHRAGVKGSTLRTFRDFFVRRFGRSNEGNVTDSNVREKERPDLELNDGFTKQYLSDQELQLLDMMRLDQIFGEDMLKSMPNQEKRKQGENTWETLQKNTRIMEIVKSAIRMAGEHIAEAKQKEGVMISPADVAKDFLRYILWGNPYRDAQLFSDASTEYNLELYVSDALTKGYAHIAELYTLNDTAIYEGYDKLSMIQDTINNLSQDQAAQ